MNVDNMLRIADAIERSELDWFGFNMATVWSPDFAKPDVSGRTECGTVGCIAGWTVTIAKNLKNDKDWYRYDHDVGGYYYIAARTYLEIDGKEAAYLFEPTGWQRGNITACEAVRQLRYAALTGDCRWPLDRHKPLLK